MLGAPRSLVSFPVFAAKPVRERAIKPGLAKRKSHSAEATAWWVLTFLLILAALLGIPIAAVITTIA